MMDLAKSLASRISRVDMSIIIPAYNEEKRIKTSLVRLLSYFKENFRGRYEVIIIMDGCTDLTPKVVGQMAEVNDEIIPLYFPTRLGKGGAFIEAFKHAKGGVLLLVDADLPTPPAELVRLFGLAKRHGFVIGSRYAKDSRVLVKEPTLRLFLGRGFNVVSKLLFWRLRGISDTQCGLKAIRADVVGELSKDLFITGFAFDVNLIYSAMRHGFNVKEVGVAWTHEESGSKVSGALLKLMMGMFFSLVKLRLYYSRFKRILETGMMKKLSEFVWRLTAA